MTDDIDRQVAHTINRYIHNTHEATKKNGLELIEATFYAIRDARQGMCLNDVVITSAEHYLFARYFVGSFVGKYIPAGAPLAYLILPRYDTFKAIVGAKNVPRAEGKCPASELDPHHTRWKKLGIIDGDWDNKLPQRFMMREVKPGWFR